MAEAVFESLHPLDSYFIESLDDAFCVNMPGATAEMVSEQPRVDQDTERQDWVPWRPTARWGLQAAGALLEYVSITDTPAIQFAERFKYIIISSSLLDTSLAPKSALPTVSRFPSPLASPLPAQREPRATIHLGAASHADGRPTSPSLHLNTEPPTPSFPPPAGSTPAVVATTNATRHPPDKMHPYLRYLLASPTIRRNAPILAVTFALALNGYVLFAFLSLLTLKTTRTKELEAQAAARNMSYGSTLDAVQSLINANNVWSAVVGEAMGILEQEEKQLFYGPVPTNSPSTSIRVALASTLHSTQSQSETVRQLFTPLTSSTQLARLSEMYMPPSPTLTKATLSPSPHHSRPASMYGIGTSSKRSSVIGSPGGRKAELSKPMDKRSTWSGATSRAALSRSGSLKGLKVEEPVSPVAGPSSPRRQKKRLSTVYGDDSPPVSPQTLEEQQTSESERPSLLIETPRDIDPKTPQRSSKKVDSFTATPSMIRRRRRNSSLSGGRPSPIPASQPLSLKTTRPASASSAEQQQTPSIMTHSRSHHSLSAVTPLSAKLPTIQTTRHPLSLTALHSQLRNAIAAKRFTSAHLLALRFGGGLEETAREELELLDGEDESYWEDVRSVASLLTSALEDASANLSEALEEGKQEKEKDAQPSPLNIAFPGRDLPLLNSARMSILGSPFAEGMISSTPSRASVALWSRFASSPGGSSFAPTESHLTRFSAHVNGLLEAMDNAKLQLKECISVVQTVVDGPSALPYAVDTPPLQTALQSYDRLRKELSAALREFERGRGSLLDLIKYQNLQQESQQQHADESDGEDEEDGLPSLALDQSSNEADSEDRHGPLLPVHAAIYNPEHDVITSPPMVAVEDPASQHLLITADPGHLPPPHGIEQVFAYDHSKEEAGRQLASAAAFNRERSKLSREERIALAKAKRTTSAQSGSLSTIAGSGNDDSGGEPAWGPGGEVVQELKHVISRVEERRKLEASKRLSVLGELATSSASPEPVVVASEPRLPATLPSPPMSPVAASGQHEADPQSSGFFGVAI